MLNSVKQADLYSQDNRVDQTQQSKFQVPHHLDEKFRGDGHTGQLDLVFPYRAEHPTYSTNVHNCGLLSITIALMY